MLQLRPILSTLRRHKIAAALIVLEIALTCAIVCNAVFLIARRIERLEFRTGLAESELVVVSLLSIGKDANAAALTREDLAALRALPGVKSVAMADQMPFGDNNNNTGINLDPDQPTPTVSASIYSADAGAVGTLGLRLVAGRDFLPDEYQDPPQSEADIRLPAVIVTQAVADGLFPGGNALGKTIYVYGKSPTRIVGVVERLARPHPTRDNPSDLLSFIAPVHLTYRDAEYLLRVDPARRDEVLKAAVEALDRKDGRRVVQHHVRYDDLRERFYRSDRAMVRLLAGICLALLVVTAFGIVGLVSFWVQQRTHMIGTRRALGATRAQIRAYFQVENLLLTTAGIALGMLGAFGINQWLITQYELARLPLPYLPLGAIVLWTLGQVAVLAPARRASQVPPALAMRGLVG